MFFGKIYTADINFTRPPVATVATNFKSVTNFIFIMDPKEQIVVSNCLWFDSGSVFSSDMMLSK